MTLLKDNENQIHQLRKKKGHLIWPAHSKDSEKRTITEIQETTQKIIDKQEGNLQEDLLQEDLKGFVGRSLFLDIEGFNFIDDIPGEYLHSVCLGVVKRLLELTFSVGEKRHTNITRRLTPPKKYNEQIKEIKCPKEFSRRSRALDLSVMKGQEMRNLILFFFPLIINSIPNETKEKTVWLLLAYMVRACVLPNNEFNVLDPSLITTASDNMYELYEQLYGVTNCTYSIHLVCSHLLQIRGTNPLTETSAFKFESFYGELRRSFVTGTPSTLKQMFQTIYLRRSLQHNCKESIYLSPKETTYQSNCYIYTFINEEYECYKILNVTETHVLGHPIGIFPHTFSETPYLNWNSIGVFKRGGINNICLLYTSPSPRD